MKIAHIFLMLLFILLSAYITYDNLVPYSTLYSDENNYNVPKNYKIIKFNDYYIIKRKTEYGNEFYCFFKYKNSFHSFKHVTNTDDLVLFKNIDTAKGAIKYFEEKENKNNNLLNTINK